MTLADDFRRDQQASRRVGGGYEALNPVTGTVNVRDRVPDEYEISVTETQAVDGEALTLRELPIMGAVLVVGAALWLLNEVVS
jgi:hypothetical protein